MDYEFTLDSQTKRNAFRARIPGLEAVDEATGKAYAITDLSATGMSFLDPDMTLAKGSVLHLDITIAKHIFLEDIVVRVRRAGDDGGIGVSFEELPRHKELRLDKLILEAQKRLIALKKKQEQEEGKS